MPRLGPRERPEAANAFGIGIPGQTVVCAIGEGPNVSERIGQAREEATRPVAQADDLTAGFVTLDR